MANADVTAHRQIHTLLWLLVLSHNVVIGTKFITFVCRFST
jgi:hypothetical protein